MEQSTQGRVDEVCFIINLVLYFCVFEFLCFFLIPAFCVGGWNVLNFYFSFIFSLSILLSIHSILFFLFCLCCLDVLTMDTQQPNRILLVTIHHMLYPITVEVLHQVFSPHGYVEKIVTFQKSAGQLFHIFLSSLFFSHNIIKSFLLGS